MAFALKNGARHSLVRRSGFRYDAAGFADAADRSIAPPERALDAALRPRAFPPETGSLLPGLLAATRTGPSPAGDDELMHGSRHHRPPHSGRTSLAKYTLAARRISLALRSSRTSRSKLLSRSRSSVVSPSRREP